jgi:hypothetical protein
MANKKENAIKQLVVPFESPLQIIGICFGRIYLRPRLR